MEETVEKGNITYNSKQIFGYPAGIILIVRNATGLEVILWALETEGRKLWLVIKEKKPKYTKTSSAQARKFLQRLKIGNFKCKGVNSFAALGKL